MWWPDPVAALAMVPIIAKQGLEGVLGETNLRRLFERPIATTLTECLKNVVGVILPRLRETLANG
jgi:hypothetical protein